MKSNASLYTVEKKDTSHVMRKPVYAICEQHRRLLGADQPAHPHSLISTFVVRCLDRIIFRVSISEISSQYGKPSAQ